jgi:phosphoglycolate phosphatase
MSTITTVIFDFDGTLVDSLPCIVEVARTLSGKYGYPEDFDLEHLRNESPFQIRKELGWSWFKALRFIAEMRPLVSKRMRMLPLHPGTKQVLQKLQKTYTVGILTTNSRETVDTILGREGVTVSFLDAGSGLFSKDHAIRKLLKRRKLQKDEVVYVGDELRDIDACRKAGIPVIAVSWGMNKRSVLEAAKPDYLIDSPAVLVSTLDTSRPTKERRMRGMKISA